MTSPTPREMRALEDAAATELAAGCREVELSRLPPPWETQLTLLPDVPPERPRQTPEEAAAMEAELWEAAMELMRGLGAPWPQEADEPAVEDERP